MSRTKRAYPDKPLVGVGVVMIVDGKILLERRSNAPGMGKWSIPGGKVEVGESLEQALKREAKEETGLEIGRPQLLDAVDAITRDEKGRVKFHFVIVDYFLNTVHGTVTAGSDAAELAWVRLEDVLKYDLTKSFRTFFDNNLPLLKTLNTDVIP